LKALVASRVGRLRLLAVLLVLTASLSACSSGNTDAGGGQQFKFTGATPAGELIAPGERSPAPSFTGELLDGSSFESTSLAGNPAVLNFWGSWCPPCRVETPDLQAVYTDVEADGVNFLGVDVKDERQLAKAFVADVGAQYPSLFDPRGEVALAFRGFPANVIPSTIVLDKDGRVAAVYTGQITQETLRTALASLLKEGGS